MNKFFYFMCASVLCSVLLSCEEKECKELETRCHKNMAQICNPDGEWVTFHDCNKEEGFSCFIPIDKKASCYPMEIIPIVNDTKDTEEIITND